MPFDGRGRKEGYKKCSTTAKGAFHSWAAFDWTIEEESFFTIEQCDECGIERKQYKRIATEEEKKQFLKLEQGKGYWKQFTDTRISSKFVPQ